jgi:enoyl-CoA hydratase/carnithine racemase
MKLLGRFPNDNKPQVELSCEETKENCIYLLRMCNGENSFSDIFVRNLQAALDFILAHSAKFKLPTVLITTGTDKFYSTGLDISFLVKEKDPLEFMNTLYYPLLQKFLKLAMPTIAAINGHAYAGGLVLAMSHDFRIMRNDRGFLCMNEVILPSQIPAGMMSVLKSKIGNKNMLRDIVLTAKKFSAKEAMENGLIDGVAENSELLEKAMEMATELVKFNSSTYVKIKREMNKEPIESLDQKAPADLFSMFSKL